MLKMAQQQYIKHFYEKEEKSLAEFARTTDLNYRTVRKFTLKGDWSEDKLPNLEPESYPALGKLIPIINEWNVVCKNSRTRGISRLYGANRTGRFSVRIVQLQNLPQNHMSDLAVHEVL